MILKLRQFWLLFWGAFLYFSSRAPRFTSSLCGCVESLASSPMAVSFPTFVSFLSRLLFSCLSKPGPQQASWAMVCPVCLPLSYYCYQQCRWTWNFMSIMFYCIGNWAQGPLHWAMCLPCPHETRSGWVTQMHFVSRPPVGMVYLLAAQHHSGLSLGPGTQKEQGWFLRGGGSLDI